MEEYDLIIIGGGCAGYPAAVYAARFNLKTLVIAKEQGGLITTTHLVENYPGFISLSGPELAQKLEEHVKANNVPIENDIVKSVGKKGKYFIVKTEINEKEYKAKAIILATGTKHRHLNAPGEKEFQGKGVSYCATCDGPFFKNKIVGIVGGSDSAAKEAMVLAQNSKKVYMFIRSHLKAEPINADRIKKLENVEIIEGVNIKEIKGDKLVGSVELDNNKTIELNGIFIAIGMLPQNEIAKSLGVNLNDKGEVIIDKLSTTNIEGVFAAGDLTDAPWKQGIVASSEGSVAGYSVYEYINRNF
jgi:thioredoxin reductase (NADPH)